MQDETVSFGRRKKTGIHRVLGLLQSVDKILGLIILKFASEIFIMQRSVTKKDLVFVTKACLIRAPNISSIHPGSLC